MSVNTTIGMNPEKVKHFGKYFGSIDFNVIDYPSKAILTKFGSDASAGTLQIGGNEYALTLAELDRIIETCQTAKHVFFQKYRFGRC